MRRLLQLGVFILALVGLVQGCIMDTETVVDEGVGGALPSDPGAGGAEGWHPGSSGPKGPYFGGPCGYDVHVFEMPDGSVIEMILPLECNPFWIDMGDPPPESDPGDEHERPPFDEGIQGEMQQH